MKGFRKSMNKYVKVVEIIKLLSSIDYFVEGEDN